MGKEQWEMVCDKKTWTPCLKSEPPKCDAWFDKQLAALKYCQPGAADNPFGRRRRRQLPKSQEQKKSMVEMVTTGEVIGAGAGDASAAEAGAAPGRVLTILCLLAAAMWE